MEIYKIIRPYVVIVSCLLVIVPFFAQSSLETRDSTAAERYYTKASRFSDLGIEDSTIFYAQKAAQLFAEEQQWEKWYDSKYVVYYTLNSQNEFEEVIKQLRQDSVEIIPHTGSPLLSAKINDWLGYVYYGQEYFEEALEYYLIGVDILEKSNHPENQYGNLINIGIIYTMRGDYDLAITYLKRSETVMLNNDRFPSLRYVYNSLGEVYQTISDYTKAAESFRASFKYGGHEADLNYHLGSIALDAREMDQALIYSEKAIKGYTTEGWNIGELLVLKSRIFAQKNNDREALKYLLEGFSLSLEDGYTPNRELSEICIEIGQIYEQTGELDLAMDYYNQTLSLLNFQADQPENTPPDFSSIDLAVGVWLVEAFKGKGDVFQKHYLLSKDTKQLKNAIDNYEFAFAIVDNLRQQYQEENSVISLSGYEHPIYEQALNATMLLYQQTGNEADINEAFVFSQKTKAFLLAASLQNITALDNGGIPEQLIQQEKEWNRQIRRLGQEISGLRANQQTIEDSLALVDLAADKFEYLRKFQKLKEELETAYPSYYQLKYDNQTASVDDVRQSILNSNTALIDYFLGDSSIFILTITKENIDFQKIKRDAELNLAIESFIHQISNAQFASEPESNFTVFTQSAYYLYQKLLQNSLTTAGEGIDQLIIIPDGILSILPFEALLRSAPAKNKPDYSFSNLSYLLEDYVINYHYSPQILLNQRNNLKRSDAPSVFAGFAPGFPEHKVFASARTCSELGLSALQYNQVEVEGINQQLKGDIFTGQDANVDAFKKHAPQYRILHLATHACISEDNPLDHKIFFANQEYLPTHELYSLPLQAELAVLSACETGLGEIVKGEGVISLARGFSYTGCPNVITSLWSVSDKAAADIMTLFYKNLGKGLAIDHSLRSSKLEFINSNKAIYSHPYYWAAFIAVGDASRNPLGGGKGYGYWLAGLLSLGIIGFFLVKRLKVV